jgi:hypothetical protein
MRVQAGRAGLFVTPRRALADPRPRPSVLMVGGHFRRLWKRSAGVATASWKVPYQAVSGAAGPLVGICRPPSAACRPKANFGGCARFERPQLALLSQRLGSILTSRVQQSARVGLWREALRRSPNKLSASPTRTLRWASLSRRASGNTGGSVRLTDQAHSPARAPRCAAVREGPPTLRVRAPRRPPGDAQ